MPDLLSTMLKWCADVCIKCTRNQKLEKYYLDRIRTRVVSGVRTGIHASEVDGSCLYKTVLRRTLDKPPPVDDGAVLKFMRGWALETYIAPGLQLPVTKDGVTCSIDDMNAEHGLIEIKSTAKSMGNFDPLKSYYWWTHRMMIYAYAHGKTEFSLVAFFSRGNYKDIQEALRAWTYTFNKAHLKAFWENYVLPRRDLLQQVFDGRGYIEEAYKKPLIFSSSKIECSWCEMKKWEHCDGVKS